MLHFEVFAFLRLFKNFVQFNNGINYECNEILILSVVIWESNKKSMNRKGMREEMLPDEGSDDDEGDSDLTTLLIAAIRKVKYQKQRPCLERIYSVVRHKRSIDQKTVLDKLENAVAKGLILKVCSIFGTKNNIVKSH